MSARCKYLVNYDSGKAARFSDIEDAQAFGKARETADVIAPDGLVGQWRGGKPTPEFSHLELDEDERAFLEWMGRAGKFALTAGHERACRAIYSQGVAPYDLTSAMIESLERQYARALRRVQMPA